MDETAPDATLEAADATLDDVGTALEEHQGSYAAEHDGQFQQVLLTGGPSTLADIEASPLTEGLALRSADDRSDAVAAQPDLIPPETIDPVDLSLAFQVDVYDGPDGPGYQVVSFKTVDGQLWTSTRQVGPETRREQAWTPLVVDAPDEHEE